VFSVGSVVIKIFEINMNLGFIKPQSPQRTQRGWFIPSLLIAPLKYAFLYKLML